MRGLHGCVNPATAVSLPALLVGAVVVVVFFLLADRHASFLDGYPSSFASAGNSTAGRWVWVPDDAARPPYYTNRSCPLIQEHQNCLKYGRPDLGFLSWRWRPAACELPRFDAAAFLDVVRGRSLAFVGDSLARNHMQSLMCLLSKDLCYESYNFTVSIFWSPFLVKANKSGELWHLYLDEPDDAWLAGVAGSDYVVLSAAMNWFTRRSVFHDAGGRVVGCHYCLVPGVPDLTLRYSQRMALRALVTGFGGTAVVRTLSPTSHFEGGEWDKGGDCRRTRPYAADKARMAGLDLDFHAAQVEEFARAKAEAEAAGARARLLLMDTTAAMLLRPDGHPSRYGHWAHENVTLYNDCVHWCLPGPIDVWNEMLFQMLLPD
ncbi:hypothetical protein GQ55_4G258900 [Panicum hallii var. hallii]|uniref:Uncharacterized protein n=1 Tax=Panicum hallii var. hallii TaxID=1504633 RepID=A0A2T7E064_9POAL|nr:hypothetical protein GQ55_4G258900 [Panicum hallii var. hallii]